MPINIMGLKRHYQAFDGRVDALSGIDLNLSDGDFVAIVGESGSGKSTLLNILCGMDKPNAGRVFLDGVCLTDLPPSKLALMRRSKIGVVYQFYNLVPELNIRDNITLPRELDGAEVNERRLSEIMQTVGLAGRERDFPSSLSGGQQQRVAIARALYQSPALILADEPTGNLDEKNADEIISLLRRLSMEQGITVLVVTHSSRVAEAADRVIRLKEGRVVEDVRKQAQANP